MKNGRAFTLIELLVVVLIIGILAAVALPQYNRAILKSRLAEISLLGRALYDAEKIYALENGEWTADLDQLSVELPIYDPQTKRAYTRSDKKTYCHKGENLEIYCRLQLNDSSKIVWWRQLFSEKKEHTYCRVEATGVEAALLKSICQNFCGNNQMITASWAQNTYYCLIR